MRSFGGNICLSNIFYKGWGELGGSEVGEFIYTEILGVR